jgi:hypothetical protein
MEAGTLASFRRLGFPLPDDVVLKGLRVRVGGNAESVGRGQKRQSGRAIMG